MSGKGKILLDTNILINYSQNLINWSLIENSFDEYYFSIITYMEMYGFPFAIIEEKDKLDLLFDVSELLELDLEIADKVIQYRKERKRKIKLPDAIILATAAVHQMPILTDDWDDFIGIDDNVEIIRLDAFKLNK